MTERDEITRSNDYVRIVLDTFNDQRRAYAFSVNPFEVQQDGIWLEGGSSGSHGGGGGGGFSRPPIDDNPDFIWESGGRLTSQGCEVEMRIPFKSVRFADNDILVEELLSYEPSSGTVFFLGYTRPMEDSRRCGFEAVQPKADGLFAKLSYRIRL